MLLVRLLCFRSRKVIAVPCGRLRETLSTSQPYVYFTFIPVPDAGTNLGKPGLDSHKEIRDVCAVLGLHVCPLSEMQELMSKDKG